MNEEVFKKLISYLTELLESNIASSDAKERLEELSKNPTLEGFFSHKEDQFSSSAFIHRKKLNCYFDLMDNSDKEKLKKWAKKKLQERQCILSQRSKISQGTKSLESTKSTDTMLRVATEKTIREFVEPLYLFINAGNFGEKESPECDIKKSAAASIIANLAYCEINNEEFVNKERAILVPSKLFQALVQNGEYSIVTLLKSLDFDDVEVFRTKRFVAILIRANRHFFIGVRGTQFAYDWLINLNFLKSKSNNIELQALVHRGFMQEAESLSRQIFSYLRDQFRYKRILSGKYYIHHFGHSLGGAVAAIARHKEYDYPENESYEEPGSINDRHCYIFGAPRICSSQYIKMLAQPIAIKRHRDIVPSCPPRLFQFTDFQQQYFPNGCVYSSKDSSAILDYIVWIGSLAFKKFKIEHSIELYRSEVTAEAKKHTAIARHSRYNDI